MEEKKFNEKHALELIESMIGTAKQDIKENGFYFMLWGWLVFIAALLNIYILMFTSFEYHSIPWMVLMPLGGILTAIYSSRKKPVKRVKTYVEENIRYMIQAFAISMFLVCLLMPAANQWRAFYPTIMIIYAIWLYVSGGMLKFKPLMLGGLANWIIAGFCYFSNRTEVHLALIALAVLLGYIIPGHLLKSRAARNVQ